MKRRLFRLFAVVLCFLEIGFLFACGAKEEDSEEIIPNVIPPSREYLAPTFFANEAEATAAFPESFRPLFPDVSTLEEDAVFCGFSCVRMRESDDDVGWRSLGHSNKSAPQCYYYFGRCDLTAVFPDMGVTKEDLSIEEVSGERMEDFSSFYGRTRYREVMEKYHIHEDAYEPLTDGKSCVFLFSAPKWIYQDSWNYKYMQRLRECYIDDECGSGTCSTEEEVRELHPDFWRSEQTFCAYLPLRQGGNSGMSSVILYVTDTTYYGDLPIRTGMMKFRGIQDKTGSIPDRLYASFINFEIGDNEYWAMLPFFAAHDVALTGSPMDDGQGFPREARGDGNFALLEPVATKVQTYLFETYWKSKLPGENG